MLLVQIALDDAEEHARSLNATTERVFDHVHFGLDLSWDTFVCLGTFLFGLAMLRRPAFGPVIGSTGMVIAATLYAVNFATIPEPPGESAVDLGPLLGLWYAAVSARLLRPSVLGQQTGSKCAHPAPLSHAESHHEKHDVPHG